MSFGGAGACCAAADGGGLNNTYLDYERHLCPQFDWAFTALISDLEERGLLQETVVAVLSEMAIARGMVFTIEFFPPEGITTLERALDVVEYIGRGKAHLLLDTTHLFRTGGTVEQIAALDPELIGYCQLSDGRNAPFDEAYMMTAMFARDVPGRGQLPLRELIAVGRDMRLTSPELAEAARWRSGSSTTVIRNRIRVRVIASG